MVPNICFFLNKKTTQGTGFFRRPSLGSTWSLQPFSQLREKLCSTIQIYFNTQHSVEQDFYILLLMNKVN